MLPYRRRRRVPLPLLAAIGLVLGLLLAALAAAPRVEAVSPTPGAQGLPATAPIRLTFSQTMDASSVERRLSIEPAVSGEMRWEGTTLVFLPDGPWPENGVVRVRLAAGARSVRFLPIVLPESWSFTVGAPRLLYLWPADGPADLYARGLDDEEPTRLTETPSGILDYSLSAGGARIVYASESDGGSELRLLELVSSEDQLLYACPQGFRCQSPALSPEGDWLAFVQLPLDSGPGGQNLSGPERVWAQRIGDAAAVPVGPEDHITTQPAWSPSGQLVYYNNTLRAFALVVPPLTAAASPTSYIANTLGAQGAWSPDGIFLVLPEIVILDEDGEEGEEGHSEQAPFFSHLYRVEASSGVTTDLSGGEVVLVEDASPAYSPDGRWIAFARKFLEQGLWTPGRQLWVMRSDGSQARSLTDDPEFNHSAMVWAPDSNALFYMRFNQVEFSQPAEIWWMDLETGESRRLVIGGYLPQWIP